MPADILTTKGAAITGRGQETVTLYHKSGAAHVCAPVDAREILAQPDSEYSTDPPTQPRSKKSDSSHVITQPAHDHDEALASAIPAQGEAEADQPPASPARSGRKSR